MKDMFKRTTASIICSSIIAFIIGLIMVLCPDLTLKTIGIIVGIYIIIHGIILIILDFKASLVSVSLEGIISGVISIILGITLIAMPNLLSTILALALGIWIVLTSVNIIRMSMVVRKVDSCWGLLLLLGILDLIAGIIIMFNPIISSLSITTHY